jgi:hypothetical protein
VKVTLYICPVCGNYETLNWANVCDGDGSHPDEKMIATEGEFTNASVGESS